MLNFVSDPSTPHAGFRARVSLVCPAGAFNAADNLCSPCPPGRFAAETGSRECSPCPEGVYGDAPGLTTDACSGPCVPLPGFTCPAGGTSPSGVACPAGSYSTATGTGCALCPAGRFGSVPGLTTSACSGECSGAGLGHACIAGATAATGAPCPAGRYSDQGSTVCTPCPAGTFGSSEGTATETCDGPCIPYPGFACLSGPCSCLHVTYLCLQGTAVSLSRAWSMPNLSSPHAGSTSPHGVSCPHGTFASPDGLQCLAGGTPPEQRAALAALYSQLGGASWDVSTGWLVGDPCRPTPWFGLACSDPSSPGNPDVMYGLPCGFR